jgi:uncharacterized tellurite resistance protein B-like protein
MAKDMFELRRTSFEEEYFRKKDAQQVDKLKAVFQKKLDREEIRQATGITDEVVLDRLLQLNLRGELMAAFKLFPLVEIAHADGQIDEREVRAVLEAARQQGIGPDSAAYAMLERALTEGPRADARKAWYMFAEELCKALSPEELGRFRHDLLGYAERVAEASGGILNIAFTVSANEAKVIRAIEQALTPKP